LVEIDPPGALGFPGRDRVLKDPVEQQKIVASICA
jgi:hypothetical protein